MSEETLPYSDFSVGVEHLYAKHTRVLKTAMNNANRQGKNFEVTAENYWWFRDYMRIAEGIVIPLNLLELIRNEVPMYTDELLMLANRLDFFLCPWRTFVDNAEMVSFVPDPRRGIKDVRTRTKPGRFLKKYLGNYLSDDLIEKIASSFTGGVVKFFEGADLPAIYQQCHGYPGFEGLNSCMTYGPEHFPNTRGHHPTEAYGKDWRLALWKPTEDSSYQGRALVNERSQTFVRCYGSRMANLRAQLLLRGYKFAENWDGLFVDYIDTGVRAPNGDLSKRPAILAPYLDGNIRSGVILEVDGKKVIKITRELHQVPFSQHGTARRCAHCSGFSEADGSHC